MSFIDIFKMNHIELENRIFQIKQANGKQESIFVQVLKKKFKKEDKNMIMLQIINVSDSVLYDRSKA